MCAQALRSDKNKLNALKKAHLEELKEQVLQELNAAADGLDGECATVVPLLLTRAFAENILAEAVSEASRLKVDRDALENARTVLKDMKRQPPPGYRIEERPRTSRGYSDRFYFAPSGARYTSLQAARQAYEEEQQEQTAITDQTFAYDFLPLACCDKAFEVCVVCYDGGDLMGCEMCKRLYHHECVGFKEIPDEDWVCDLHHCSGCERPGQKAPPVISCVGCARRFCKSCKRASAKDGNDWWMCRRCSVDENQLQAVMRGVLGKLLGEHQDKVEHFYRPVDTTALTDYMDFVEKPMNLESILHKVQDSHYASIDAFNADLKLIYSNCEAYCKNRYPDILATCGKLMKVAQPLVKTARTMLEGFTAAVEGDDDDGERIAKRRKTTALPKVKLPPVAGDLDANDDDTLLDIAARLNLSLVGLLALNRPRYKGLNEASKLEQGTNIQLPPALGKPAIESDEDDEDYKAGSQAEDVEMEVVAPNDNSDDWGLIALDILAPSAVVTAMPPQAT